MHTAKCLVEQFISTNYQSIIYALIIVGILCVVFQYYFRWRDYALPYILSKKKKDSENSDSPKLSVVVTTNNQAEILEERLSTLLEQDYPDFEVIVVDEASTDETRELVEQIQFRHKNLRYTFVPVSATEICRKKLAITLGIRAARSEWVVVTTISSVPVSNTWLRGLSRNIQPHVDVVIGYANYQDDGSSYAKKAIYERLRILLRCFRSANGYGAIGGDESNFCIRKQAFLDRKGYANNLQIEFGESHLLIDAMATPLNVSVAIGADLKVIEDLPPYEVWKDTRYYYREILRHSSRRTHYYLWREGLASLSSYLFLFIVLAYVCMRLLQIYLYHDISFYACFGDVGMCLLLLICIFIPVVLLRRTTGALQERNFGLSMLGYALMQPFVNIKLKLLRQRMVAR